MGQRRPVNGGTRDLGKVTPEDARTLEWAEIAGLIDIGPDGSWQPTPFGKQRLLALERDQHFQGGAR